MLKKNVKVTLHCTVKKLIFCYFVANYLIWWEMLTFQYLKFVNCNFCLQIFITTMEFILRNLICNIN